MALIETDVLSSLRSTAYTFIIVFQMIKLFKFSFVINFKIEICFDKWVIYKNVQVVKI